MYVWVLVDVTSSHKALIDAGFDLDKNALNPLDFHLGFVIV